MDLDAFEPQFGARNVELMRKPLGSDAIEELFFSH